MKNKIIISHDGEKPDYEKFLWSLSVGKENIWKFISKNQKNSIRFVDFKMNRFFDGIVPYPMRKISEKEFAKLSRKNKRAALIFEKFLGQKMIYADAIKAK